MSAEDKGRLATLPGVRVMPPGERPADTEAAGAAEADGRVRWLGALVLVLTPFAIFAALAILDSFIR